MPEAVRAQLAGGLQARAARKAPNQAPGLRFIHPPALVVDEQRATGAIGEVGVEGAFNGRGEGLQRVAAALAGDAQHAVALLMAEMLDLARQRLVDAQAVEGQQRDQRRRPRPVGLGGIQQLLELVARKPTLIESVLTWGRLTFATGFSSSTATSTP